MIIRHLQVLLAPLLLFAVTVCVPAQEQPAPSPPAPEPPSEAGAPKPAPHARQPLGFLIRGTVFDNQGLSLPRAELRIRRAGEKKFRWSTYTNSRGEFAIRVPPGNQYEVVVESKAFAEAVRPVNAANGLDEESLTIRMELAAGRKQ